MKSSTKKGKGMNADVVNAVTKGAVKTTGVSPFSELLLSKVFANPDQPRKSFENIDELASSIERHGLVQPIAVVKKEKGYMIISGERRFRAMQELGKKTIKAHIMDVDVFSVQELALVENIQREDLTAFETALYVNELSHRYASHGELAARLGKPTSYISKCKSALKLSTYIQGQIVYGREKIGIEVLSELSRVKDQVKQEKLYDEKATREEIREVCRKEKEVVKKATSANKKVDEKYQDVVSTKQVSKISPAKKYSYKLDMISYSPFGVHLRTSKEAEHTIDVAAPTRLLDKKKKYKITIEEI